MTIHMATIIPKRVTTVKMRRRAAEVILSEVPRKVTPCETGASDPIDRLPLLQGVDPLLLVVKDPLEAKVDPTHLLQLVVKDPLEAKVDPTHRAVAAPV